MRKMGSSFFLFLRGVFFFGKMRALDASRDADEWPRDELNETGASLYVLARICHDGVSKISAILFFFVPQVQYSTFFYFGQHRSYDELGSRGGDANQIF